MKIPVKLETFKGWTVDLRLKEFRKVRKLDIKFLPFTSYEGDLLLTKYLNSMQSRKTIKIAKMIF